MTWAPVLAGAAAARAHDAIDRVARALCDPDPAWQLGPSLADGDAGLAVFYAYLDRAAPTAGWGAYAERYLERAIDAMAAAPMSPSLHHGFVGIAWSIEHLTAPLREPGDDDPCTAIDDAIAAMLDRPAASGDFDLMNGLPGAAIYLIERRPNARAHALLARVVDRLATLAERDRDGVRWRSTAAELGELHGPQFPHGAYNLGLAHGVPGVIAVLASCVEHDAAAPLARELLDGACAWIAAHAMPDGTYADLIAPGTSATRARLGWCYGDVAVATAMVRASDVLGSPTLRARAVALARAAGARSFDDAGVVDACVCHGSAGLGLLYMRLAHATGDAALRAQAIRYLDDALVRAGADPITGLAPHLADPSIPLGVASLGVLTGIAGAALALHAATTAQEPSWDRVLALSGKKMAIA